MTKNYKSLIILILFALQVVSSWAQKPFVFHNKKFRIAQFTDLHWDANHQNAILLEPQFSTSYNEKSPILLYLQAM